MESVKLLVFIFASVRAVEWKGVRYAEPVKRWQPPEPYKQGFDHALANRGSYTSCPQGNLDQSEDCLRLDIYKPDNANKLPIYIWIHGGHFKFGSGQMYGGQKFVANNDIVYVAIQYRLGHFGFLNVKGTKYTGNYGLMDQQLAIKFIHDNAHKIGGDASRITIGGESAGSISSSFQMLNSDTSIMVSQAILQSGMPNAACGDWCMDVRGHVRGICNGMDNSKCNSAGKSDEQVVDQLATVPMAEIYRLMDGWGMSVSINVKDGKFFKKDPWQIVKERSFKKNVKMMMGFTSFEGSLEKDSYPKKFNKDNFISAYQEWKSDIYNQASGLSGETIDLLARRKFHQLACKNKFQEYFDKITNREAIAMSLDIYGDIGFRCSAVSHARFYHEAGVKVYVYNFDTHENHGGQLVGAAHADELKYHNPWGSGGWKPWQFEIEKFMLASWKSFIKTGNPSYSGQVWKEFDGKEMHMEIENDEKNAVLRNDQYFDFDVFNDLNVEELERTKPLDAKCSIVKERVKVTAPPDSYCQKITLSGSETSHYNLAGTWTKSGEVNGRPAWAKGGWLLQYDKQAYCVSYGRGNTGQCVAKSSFTFSYCAAEPDITWNVWNKVTMLDIGTCDSKRWCVYAPDAKKPATDGPPATGNPATKSPVTAGPTAKKPTTQKATQAPTEKPQTRAPCSGSCCSVTVSGSIASAYEYDCTYYKTGRMFNNYPVYECTGRGDKKLLYLRKDGYIGFFTETTNGDGPPIWIKRSSDTLCPSDNKEKFGYWNTKTEALDTAEPSMVKWSEPPPKDNTCKSVTVVGTIANSYGYDCTFHKTDRMFNNYPVYECTSKKPAKFLFLRSDNYFGLHTALTNDPGPPIWIKRTSDTLCPSDNKDKFGYWNTVKEALDTAEPTQVRWGATATQPPPTTQSPPKTQPKDLNCGNVKVTGSIASAYKYDCTYYKTNRMFNNYPVYECTGRGDKKLLYLRKDGYIGFFTETTNGDGPPIWIKRSADTLCPSDNKDKFGYWNTKTNALDTAEASQVSWVSEAKKPSSTKQIEEEKEKKVEEEKKEKIDEEKKEKDREYPDEELKIKLDRDSAHVVKVVLSSFIRSFHKNFVKTMLT